MLRQKCSLRATMMNMVLVLSVVSVFLLDRASISVFPACADPPSPDWRQVNQDGFVQGLGPSIDGTDLFVFGENLYASNEFGLFRLEDPIAKTWTQLTGSGSGALSENIKSIGNYLYRWNDGQLSWSEVGPGNLTWNSVTSNGLPGNVSPEPMTLFNDKMYGIYHDLSSNTFEIWRTADIGQSVANWERVVADSFGDPLNNYDVTIMIVFKGKIYAGTTTLQPGSSDQYPLCNGSFGNVNCYGTGVEVWESPGGDAGTWNQVNADGFGTRYQDCQSGTCKDFAIHQVIGSAFAYLGLGETQEHLYIGTRTHTWGAEIWRYDGSGVGGWQNVTQPWSGPGAFSSPGRNQSMAVFQGDLYVAEGFPSANLSKFDGNSWSKVVPGPNPFDPDPSDPDVNTGLMSLAVFQDKLYVSALHHSSATAGDEVWGYPFEAPSITVAVPNGGEKWIAGTPHRIEWIFTGDPGSTVKIQLLKGTAGPFIRKPVLKTIGAAVSGSDGKGSYQWNIPTNQAPASTYKIRVTSEADGSYVDTSDQNFTILGPNAIVVSSPNGGESWQTGTKHTVVWAYTGSPGSYVKIELLKGGVLSNLIVAKTPVGKRIVGFNEGTGSYLWEIPVNQVPGTDYQIRVTSTTRSSSTDTSDGKFSIVAPPPPPPPPTVTVTSPNGGESWQAGSTQTVRWSYTGDPGPNLNIDLLKGGVFNYQIVAGIPKNNNGSGSNGSIQWTIPPSLSPGFDYSVKITSNVNSSWTDTSDGYFSITAAPVMPTITVASPNGGESWHAGSTYTVSWTYTGDPGPTIAIELLLKEGLVTSNLPSSTTIGSGGSGSYSWTIPAGQTPASSYKIRVRSTTFPSCTDASNNDFTINGWIP